MNLRKLICFRGIINITYNKNPHVRTKCGLKNLSAEKCVILITKNVRTCLVRQDQTGSYTCMWVRQNYDKHCLTWSLTLRLGIMKYCCISLLGFSYDDAVVNKTAYL